LPQQQRSAHGGGDERGDEPDAEPIGRNAGTDEAIAASTPTMPDAMPVEPGTDNDAADSIDARM
jgi:hypothetical protein